MDYKRVDGMIDIDDAINKGLIIFDEEERKGKRANKFWFNNYSWMYKDVDNDYNTYEEYAEVICYEIAKLLNIQCAEYDLATLNGRKGVITKSVVAENENIVSGNQVLNFVYEDFFIQQQKLQKVFTELLENYQITSYEEYKNLPKKDRIKFRNSLIAAYNQSCYSVEDFIKEGQSVNEQSLFEHCLELEENYPKDFVDIKNGILMSNNLYDIWYAIEVFCKVSGYDIDIEKFMNDLTNMFIFDIIVSQGDRHAENWSVVIDKDTSELKLAAIYDNSGALALNREKAIVNLNDLSKRLKIEKKKDKIAAINKRISDAINHSFSGVKVTYENVKNRSRNKELLETFIKQSSEEFVARIEHAIELIKDENNLIMIFQNIETKTGKPIPEIVKNVTRSVLKQNINQIEETLSKVRGEKYGII